MDIKHYLALSAYFYPLYFSALLIFFIVVFFLSYPNFRKSLIRITSKDVLVLFFLLLMGLIFRLKYTAHTDLDSYAWDYIESALSIKNYFLNFPILHSDLLKSTHIPGYPFFIFFPLIFFKNIYAISVFNICFSILTIPVTYFVSNLITEDKLASFLAAAILTFSSYNTFYSGYEIPMSISVFFVSLQFLYFVVWLKTRSTAAWLTFVTLFFISVNIKVENSVFLPLFTVIGAKELIKDKPQKLINYSATFLLLLLISCIFYLPFLKNLWYIQMHSVPSDQLISWLYLLRYSLKFLVQIPRGYPVFTLLGIIILKLMRKSFKLDYLILGWFLLSLLVYSYCMEIDARWHTTQVLVPIFIISGYVISQSLKIFFTNTSFRHILLILFCFFYFLGNERQINGKKPYSWQELIRDLKTDSEKSCIISQDFLDDFLVTKFSLPFLLPKKTWLFLSDKDLEQKMCQCKGNIYYFNPIPYGLIWEASLWNNEEFSILENKIKKRYNLIRIGDIDFFQLKTIE